MRITDPDPAVQTTTTKMNDEYLVLLFFTIIITVFTGL